MLVAEPEVFQKNKSNPVWHYGSSQGCKHAGGPQPCDTPPVGRRGEPGICRTLLAQEALARRYKTTRSILLDTVVAQNGACPVCGEELTGQLCVDHCHDRGTIRGVIHKRCNNGLGLFRDDPEALERAAAYLRKHDKVA